MDYLFHCEAQLQLNIQNLLNLFQVLKSCVHDKGQSEGARSPPLFNREGLIKKRKEVFSC